jgi:hypothetical protein
MAKKSNPQDAIRREAQAILREQQRILAQASSVARNATHEFGRYAQDEVFPRIASGSRRGVSSARHAIVDDVLPAVGAAVGAALNLLDGKAPKGALAAARKALSGSASTKAASGPGVGTIVAVGVGLAALIGIGYIAYQTFRADDELWVAEDDDL